MTQEISILIVDDEFSVRDSLGRWFAAEGFRVGMAGDGTVAMHKLFAEQWDVVLLDIKMRGMDGLQLQTLIHDHDPRIIVIMITAYATVSTAVQALKAGAHDYVTKPFDPEELTDIVRQAVAKRDASST